MEIGLSNSGNVLEFYLYVFLLAIHFVLEAAKNTLSTWLLGFSLIFIASSVTLFLIHATCTFLSLIVAT